MEFKLQEIFIIMIYRTFLSESNFDKRMLTDFLYSFNSVEAIDAYSLPYNESRKSESVIIQTDNLNKENIMKVMFRFGLNRVSTIQTHNKDSYNKLVTVIQDKNIRNIPIGGILSSIEKHIYTASGGLFPTIDKYTNFFDGKIITVQGSKISDTAKSNLELVENVVKNYTNEFSSSIEIPITHKILIPKLM